MRIALDVMGGDHGPLVTIEGAMSFLRESPGSDQVVLIGDRDLIKHHLQKQPLELIKRCPIVHAPENISMNESPTDALKKKKNSSMVVGLEMHGRGESDAFVSAGNTGAQMAGSLISLKRIHGVRRPGIGAFLPTEQGIVFLIDVGANVDSRPADLLQFAMMGNIFVTEVFGRTNLKTSLLNIGEEEKKGNELTLQSYQLLKENLPNFNGNIEGRDLLKGKADIVVCDGFVGNVVLKMAESVLGVLVRGIKKSIGRNVITNIGAYLVKPAFSELKRLYDYEEYGGVPLLGVNGISIICHGSSGPKAIKNALKVAKSIQRRNVNRLISEKLNRKESAE
jgi:glycerol-3-phosphate acyltransferase PlsX